jgi:hypothetical protein
MKTKISVLTRGEKFAAQGSGQFVKDVVRVGKWYHPVTGRDIVFTAERLERLRLNTAAYLAAGNKIPFRDGHRNSTLATMGEWKGPFIVFKDRLVGVVEPKDPKALEGVRNGSIDRISAVIEFDYTDSGKNHYDEVITAVDATDFPVLTGQRAFAELSRDAEGNELDTYVEEEVFSRIPKGSTGTVPEGHRGKEIRMDPLKLMAKTLGLPEDASPERIFEALVASQKLAAETKTAKDELAAEKSKTAKLIEQMAAHGFKLEGEKLSRTVAVELDVTPKDGDTDEVKAWKSEVAKTRQDEAMKRVNTNKAFVTKLAADLKLEPALTGLMEEVLGVKSELEAVTLSTDGKNLNLKKVGDFPGKLRGLFEKLCNLPKVQPGGVTQLGTDHRKDSEATDQKSREQMGTELASLADPSVKKQETAAAK